MKRVYLERQKQSFTKEKKTPRFVNDYSMIILRNDNTQDKSSFFYTK